MRLLIILILFSTIGTVNSQSSKDTLTQYKFEQINLKKEKDSILKFYIDFYSCYSPDSLSKLMFIPFFHARDRNDPMGYYGRVRPAEKSLSIEDIKKQMDIYPDKFINPLAKYYFICSNSDSMRYAISKLNQTYNQHFWSDKERARDYLKHIMKSYGIPSKLSMKDLEKINIDMRLSNYLFYNNEPKYYSIPTAYIGLSSIVKIGGKYKMVSLSYYWN